jgi:hypothetical protein
LTQVNAAISLPCHVDHEMRNLIRHIPARLLTPDERALFDTWFAAVGDVASAYVSSRAGDDPVLQHRIVVIARKGDEPSHIVYAPAGRDIWIVFLAGRRTRVRRFRALRDALNFVRPVLVEAEPVTVPIVARDRQAPLRNSAQA